MPRPARATRATILVVDDDRALRTLVATTLRNDGHRVITAGDGAEALSALEGTQVELIVSDVAMPGLDGRGIGHALWEQRRHIPILFMSAFPQQPELLPGAFLAKPFRYDELLTRVRELLSR